MKVKVAGYAAECDTDYALKVEFRNQQIYRTQGFNQFTKTYAIHTACCDECDTCLAGDANEVSLLLAEAINVNGDDLMSAEIIARNAIVAATHGTSAAYAIGDVMTDADVKALITFNSTAATDADKVYTDLMLTTKEIGINKYCEINLLHFVPRGTFVIASLVEGFSCGTTVTTEQELAFEEGSGYDVGMKEWYAAGNQQNKPYRVSETTNTAIGVDSFADRAVKYDQFYIEDNFVSYMEGRPLPPHKPVAIGATQEIKLGMQTIIELKAIQ